MRKISLLHIIIALIFIIVGSAIYWLVANGQVKLKLSSATKGRQEYQAVFLANGQVYFGKLQKIGRDFVELTDIYYLQVNQQQIQPKPEEGPTQKPNEEQPQLTLVKLGKEIHGPDDKMNINRQQILFWEDLNDSGQVVQAIKKDKESKK